MTRLSFRSLVGLAATSACLSCFGMREIGPLDRGTEVPLTVEGVARAFQLDGVPWAPIPIAKYAGSQIDRLILADDAAYCVTELGAVYAVAVADGTPRWNLELGMQPDRDNGFAYGFDRVGFLSANHLTVVRSATGARLLETGLNFAPSSPGVLTEDSFFAGAWGNGYAMRSATLIDGWVGWAHQVDDAITAKPLLLGGGADRTLVFAAHDGRVVAVEPRSSTAAAPEAYWSVTTTGKNLADLASDGQLVFVACDDGVVYAISRSAGAVRWKWFGASEPLSRAPAAANGMVYQPISGGVVALDGATGVERWRVPQVTKYLTRIGERDFFAAPDRTIVAVDTTTGNPVHTVHCPLFTMLETNPTSGTLVFSDGESLYAIR